MKLDESVFEEKSFFETLGFTFSSELDWGSYIISVAKTAKKNWSLDLFYEISFPRLLCISIRIPNCHT